MDNEKDRSWSPCNALSLANCALLAYNDDQDIQRHLLDPRRNFEQVIPCNSPHHAADTQAYVAVRPDMIVVAFRGTEPTNLEDFATDFNASQVPFESKLHFTGWGRVHEGWADGANVVLSQVLDALKGHGDASRSLWITGHSLGGALAMVTAAFLANGPDHPIAGVYTFGQPRVGNPVFKARYDQALGDITFRCVNDRDLVPHVPPRELARTERALVKITPARLLELADALVHHEDPPDRYEHAGKLRLLLPEGGLTDNPDDEAAREPAFFAKRRTARTLVRELPRLLAESPELINDHAPINAPLTHLGYIECLEALCHQGGK